jgi:carbohydrate diacid regulator
MKEYSDPKFIYQQLKGLGYSYKDFHYFVVFDIQEYNQQDTELFNSIHNSFEKRIAFQDLFTRSQNQFYLLSKRETIDDLKHELTQLKQYVENKYNVHVGIGISQKIDNFDKVYKFVMQAQTVIDIFKVKRSSYIQQFEPSSLKFLFQGFAKYIPNDFSHYVLGDIEETEKEQIKELIYTYIKANGSIKLASEELFVHKNTFQYRLNKVKEQLGYNPRDLEDLIILYIALELDNK